MGYCSRFELGEVGVGVQGNNLGCRKGSQRVLGSPGCLVGVGVVLEGNCWGRDCMV